MFNQGINFLQTWIPSCNCITCKPNISILVFGNPVYSINVKQVISYRSNTVNFFCVVIKIEHGIDFSWKDPGVIVVVIKQVIKCPCMRKMLLEKKFAKRKISCIQPQET